MISKGCEFFSRSIIQCITQTCESPEAVALFLAACYDDLTELECVADTLGPYAAKHGYHEILELAVATGLCVPDDRLPPLAARSGDEETLLLLLRRMPGFSLEHILEPLASSGSVALFHYLSKLYLQSAIVNPMLVDGSDRMLRRKYCANPQSLEEDTMRHRKVCIMAAAAESGNVVIMRELLAQGASTVFGLIDEIFVLAFLKGRVDMMELMTRERNPDLYMLGKRYTSVVESGSLEAVQWMYQKCGNPSEPMCTTAACAGSVELLEWFRATPGFPCDLNFTRIFETAAICLQFKVMDWVFEQLTGTMVPGALENFIWNGIRCCISKRCTKVVEWALAHTKASCVLFQFNQLIECDQPLLLDILINAAVVPVAVDALIADAIASQAAGCFKLLSDRFPRAVERHQLNVKIAFLFWDRSVAPDANMFKYAFARLPCLLEAAWDIFMEAIRWGNPEIVKWLLSELKITPEPRHVEQALGSSVFKMRKLGAEMEKITN